MREFRIQERADLLMTERRAASWKSSSALAARQVNIESTRSLAVMNGKDPALHFLVVTGDDKAWCLFAIVESLLY